MNRFFVLSAVLFGLLFIGVLFLSFGSIRSFPVSGEGEDNTIRYVFAVFLPDKDYLYYNRLRQGINDRARELNCAVSFYPADRDAVGLNLTPLSGYDGAAYYPLGNQDELQDRIREVVDSSFPLVLIEHLLPTDPTLYMVGTNTYDVGQIIGELVLRARREEEPRIIFFYSEKNPGLLADRQTLELGFRLALEDLRYSILYDETSSNPLDAEMRVNSALKDHPDTNLLILTDPNDTLAALQVIVDRNLVGKVEIIGFGDDPTIREYIDKGVLGGAVVPNSYRIGSQVVQTLYEIADTGASSAFSNVDASILTGEPRP